MVVFPHSQPFIGMALRASYAPDGYRQQMMHTMTMWRSLSLIVLGLALVALAVRVSDFSKPQPAPSQIAASAAVATSTASASKVTLLYPVERIVDGDTIGVDMSGASVKIRLIGLDTPETVDPRKPVQCFGREASEKAKQMLSGQHVRIENDASQGEYDKYGRLLAYVYLPDGTLFNEYMIAEGYGHEYTYNLPYKYQSEFKAAEARARAEKKGLWADGACS